VQTESLAEAFGGNEPEVGEYNGPDYTDRDFSSAGTRTRNDDDDEGPAAPGGGPPNRTLREQPAGAGGGDCASPTATAR